MPLRRSARPAFARALVLALALAAAAAPGVARGAPPDDDPCGLAPLGAGLPGDAYAEAVGRTGVPEVVLRAVVEEESGGRMSSTPTRDGRLGATGLVAGRTLERAAALTGLSPGALASDARANLLGGAAVLAELAATSGSLEETLARYAGLEGADADASYAARVVALVGEAAVPWGAGGALAPGWTPGGGVLSLLPLPPSPYGYPPATWVGPACDYTNASRGPGDLRFVIIHTCEGGFSGCWSWLRGCHDVSAHYVVSNRGDVVNIVADADIAWHAGCVNGTSIGIEHEGSSLHPENFTHDLYCASAQLTRWLCDSYGIPCDRDHVIGHGEANDRYCGGTHWDPGPGWDWGRYMEYVRCGCGGCCTAEVCNDRDDDCDGAVDEDVTRACGSDVGECRQGTETCARGGWGACEGAIGPAPELCDRRDNDCDGASDEDEVCEREEAALQAGVHEPGGTTDVDGDGRADLCARGPAGIICALSARHAFGVAAAGPALDGADGGDGASLAYVTTLRMGDLDGDGRADLCVRGTEGVSCWLARGAGFGVRLVGPPLSDAAGWDRLERFATLRMADVTGDGRADLCARSPEGFDCWPSRGDGFGAPTRIVALSDAAGWGALPRWASLRLGDVDGDGAADVCGRDADGVSCWIAGEEGLDRRIVGPRWSDAEGWGALDCTASLRLGDVNGDGRDDVCGRCGDALRCALAGGDGLDEIVVGPPMRAQDGWTDPARFSTIRLADVDGDRAADVCALDGEALACWAWTGAGFGRRVSGPTIPGAAATPAIYRTLRMADVSGDGLADACLRLPDGVRCWHSSGDAFGEMVIGPPWTDAAGWDGLARFSTVRGAGPGTVGAHAEGPGGAPGGCACRAGGGGRGSARGGEGGDGGGRGGGGAAAVFLVAVAVASKWRRRVR